MVEKSCHAPFRCGSGEPGGTESTEASAILRVCVYQNLPSALQRRLPENLTNILVLAAPDIAVDKWSLSILLDDLTVFYSSASETSIIGDTETDDFFQGGRSAVPFSLVSEILQPVEMDYALFSQYRMTNILKGPIGDQMWAYWQQILSGPRPVLHMPTDRLRPRHRCRGP